MTNNLKVPGWYWALAIIMLLWNLMGCLAFFQDLNQTAESLKEFGFNEEQIAHALSSPKWPVFPYAIAVFGGLIGCIGLLLRRKFALPFFIVSLLAASVYHIFNMFINNGMEIYGTAFLVMAIVVIVICLFLVWFAKLAIGKNWLK